MDLNHYFKKRTDEINNTLNKFSVEIKYKPSLNKDITPYINGMKHRVTSMHYHIDLIKREIYNETPKIFKICQEKGIPFYSPILCVPQQIIVCLIRNRSTFLLRDIIADFFGAMDNLAKLIVQLDKNAKGERMSRVVRSLKNHSHSKDKKLTKYLVKNWDEWLDALYNGYRKDAIHFNPENCKIYYNRRCKRVYEDYFSHEENIMIKVPETIQNSLGIKSEIDLLNFCFMLEKRLFSIIRTSLFYLRKYK